MIVVCFIMRHMSQYFRNYSVEELADRYDVHRATIHRWIHRGFFPNAFQVGRYSTSAFVIPGADVMHFDHRRGLNETREQLE